MEMSSSTAPLVGMDTKTSDTSHNSSHRNQMPNPLLSIFATFNLACIIGLAVIHTYDKKLVGLDVMNDVPDYVWKFGPTALFTLVIAYWRLVIYKISQNVVWEELSRAWCQPQKSVLLDYVSPILPTIISRAATNRHWSVVTAINTFMLLKATVLFSTALFTLTLSAKPPHTTVLDLDRQKAPAVNDSRDLIIRYMRSESIGLQYLSLQKGLAWPSGAAPGAAYHQLTTSSQGLPENSTATVNVQAAYSIIDCEVAEATFEQTFIPDIWAIIAYDDWSNPLNDSCLGYQCDTDVPFVRRTRYDAWSQAIDQNADVIDRSGLDVRVSLVSPTLSAESGFIYDPACIDPASYCGNETVRPFFQQVYLNDERDCNGFAIGFYSMAQDANTTSNAAGSRVNWSSAMLCRVKYTMGRGDLVASADRTGHWNMQSFTSTESTEQSQHPTFTNGNLSTEIAFASQFTSMYQSGLLRPGLADPHQAWFTLMKRKYGAEDMTPLQDPSAMAVSARAILSEMAPNAMASFVTFSDEATANASYVSTRTVLRLNATPFYLMQGALSCGLICLVILLVIVGNGLSFHADDPTSLISSLLTCADSAELSSLVTRRSALSDSQLIASMQYERFKIVDNESRVIQVDEKLNLLLSEEDLSHIESIETSYWSTWASQKYYGPVVGALAILSIALLEIMQNVSDKGSVSLLIKSELGEDLGMLIPAATMLLLAMLFTAIDFTASVLSPCLQLFKRAKCLAQVDRSILHQLFLVSIWNEFRAHRWSGGILMSMGLMASVLTTISAGLYTIAIDSFGTNATVSTRDQFNLLAVEQLLKPADQLSSEMFATLQSFAFVQSSNGSYLPGVYDEVTYPLPDFDKIILNSNISTQQVQNLSLQVGMPVLRPSLTCWTVPRENMIVEVTDRLPGSLSPVISGSKLMVIYSVLTVPPGCPDLGSGVSNSDANATYAASTSFIIDKADNNLEFGGTIAPIQNVDGGLFPRSSKVDGDYLVAWPDKHKAPACPTFAVFTLHKPSANDSAVAVNNLLCTEGVDEIQAQLTFNVSTGNIDEAKPPVIIESTAKPKLARGLAGWGYTYFYYALDPATLRQQYDRTFDGFFSSMVYGPEGIPIEELVYPDQIQRLMNATIHTYRQYYAQFISNVMRINATSSTLNNSTSSLQPRQASNTFSPIGTQLNARIIDNNVRRVVQNRTPKLILQCLIGAMVLCLACGYRDLVAMGRLVKHNPCHLIGRISLWAGSQIVHDLKNARKHLNLDSRVQDDVSREKVAGLRVKLQQFSIPLTEKEISNAQITDEVPCAKGKSPSSPYETFALPRRRRVMIDYDNITINDPDNV